MANQSEVAKHLDMSVRNLREVLGRLGLNTKNNTLDEIRVAYIRHVREGAAGRGGNDQVNLTRARTREAVASAHLKELDVKTKMGTLIPVDEIEPSLEALVVALRTELLILPDKLTMAVKTMYDVDIDPLLIEEPIHEALQHFADGTSASDDSAS